jgi:hypothetical protein
MSLTTPRPSTKGTHLFSDKDKLAKGGRPDIMSVVAFRKAMLARTQDERAVTQSDFRDILLQEKSNLILLQGQDPALVTVATKTVRCLVAMMICKCATRSPKNTCKCAGRVFHDAPGHLPLYDAVHAHHRCG